MSFFFFQAEDGIRDVAVTGVQTCALPISREIAVLPALLGDRVGDFGVGMAEVGNVGAADGVEVAFAAFVDEPAALAPHDLWVLVAQLAVEDVAVRVTVAGHAAKLLHGLPP